MKTKLLIFMAAIGLAFNSCSAKDPDYFTLARKEIAKRDPARKDLVIVIDYRKNLLTERLYLLDMETGREVLSSTVAHAWNSGALWATDFSNKQGSKKSSYGAFVTGGKYFGKFGESMRVRGLEPGVNGAAQARAIVFHSTEKMKGPWSDGCFATPKEVNSELIRLTQGGCLVLVIKQ